MRKNIIRNVIIDKVESADKHTLSKRTSALHAEIIERKLNQSGLSKKNKIEVLDKIIENIKSVDTLK